MSKNCSGLHCPGCGHGRGRAGIAALVLVLVLALGRGIDRAAAGALRGLVLAAVVAAGLAVAAGTVIVVVKIRRARGLRAVDGFPRQLAAEAHGREIPARIVRVLPAAREGISRPGSIPEYADREVIGR